MCAGVTAIVAKHIVERQQGQIALTQEVRTYAFIAFVIIATAAVRSALLADHVRER